MSKPKVEDVAKKDVTATEAATNQPRSRETVTVACKMPNGMVLQLFRQEKQLEPVQGGGSRLVIRHIPTGEPVIVAGPAAPIGAAPRALVFGGYALTPNVSKEFWDEWLRQNAKLETVVKRIIFAEPTQHRAQDAAVEMASVRTGLEPLNQDPRKEPRTPKVTTPNLDPLSREEAPASNRAAA